MEPNERMRVMLSLMGDDSILLAAHDTINPQHIERRVDAVPFSNTAAVPLAPYTAIPNALPDALIPNAAMGIDEEQKEEHISSYCNITGSDPESARHLLEVIPLLFIFERF